MHDNARVMRPCKRSHAYCTRTLGQTWTFTYTHIYIYIYIYIHDIACLRPPILTERCSTECGCIARGCSPLEVMSAWGAVSCGSFEFYHSLAQQTWKVSLDPWLKLTVEDLANLSLSPSLANTRQSNCRLSAVFLEFCSRPRTSWRMVTSPSPVRG